MAAENWWTVPAEADAGAEALAQLREQRWLLGALRDEVDDAGRRLAAEEVGAGWRSPAQRIYLDRLAELRGDLQTSWRALTDALAAVDDAIVQVKVSS